MNKRVVLLGALVVIATIVLTALAYVLSAKPPQPIIEIKGEPLTTIGPLDILNTLFTAWVVMAILLIFSFIAVRKRAMVPSGIYNLFEAIIEAIDEFVTRIAGANGRRFFPLVATFFLYIALANWLSLTPLFNSIGVYVPLHAEEGEFHEQAVVFEDGSGVSLIPPGAEFVELHADDCAAGHEGDACREHAIEEATATYAAEGEKLGVLFPFLRGINTDLMTPLSFALVSVFFIEYWGITSLGFFAYMRKFFNFGPLLKGLVSLNVGAILNGMIEAFVGVLEFIAEIAKLISFSFRLFGNLMAGEILLLVMTFLLVVAQPILLIFYGLELFVGAVQAFVFGTLTLVFAMLATSGHGGEEHGEHAEH